MSTARQARQEIGDIIKAKPGGVYAVGTASGVHYTRIYAFLRGSAMEPENAGRLRAVLPEVRDALWADAFAPTPDVEAQA